MATLHELDSIYGLEDVYDMMEIITVDSYNRMTIAKRKKPPG